MKNLPLLIWMEDIDPELIERADKYHSKRHNTYWRIALIAAAVLLLMSVALSAFAAWRVDDYVSKTYPDTYDGTILHALDIVLTQDENAVSALLGEQNKKDWHSLFNALRGVTDDENEKEPLPESQGLEFKYMDDYCFVKGIGTCTDTEIVIPKNAPGGHTVFVISENAFSGCTEVKSFTVQDSVHHIQDMAFSGCASLETVYIADSVEQLGAMLFANCSSLKNVRLPSGITTIGKQLFFLATGLESFVVPDGVTRIGAYAFGHCTSLESIEIPDSVEVIEHGAFQYCISLTSFIIPEGVTCIQLQSFHHCDSMTRIVIPKSVTEIESEAFRGCAQLKDVYFTGTQEEWAAITIGSYNNALDSVTVHYNYDPHAAE